MGLGPAGIGLAGLTAGGLMGGGKGGSGGSTSDTARKMAWRTYKSTDPLRQGFIQEGENALAGNYKPWETDVYKYIQGLTDVQTQPIYDQALDPGKRVIESQYQRAMENALGAMPSGGALQSRMGDIEMARAQGLGDLERTLRMEDIRRQDVVDQWQAGLLSNLASGMYQDILGKGYGLAAGAPQTGIAGMTNLAGQQAQANAMSQQGKAGMMGDLGGAAGLIIGMGK